MSERRKLREFEDIHSRSDGSSSREDWFALRESTKRERASAERSRQSRERDRNRQPRERQIGERPSRSKSSRDRKKSGPRQSEARQRPSNPPSGRDTRRSSPPPRSARSGTESRGRREPAPRQRKRPMSRFKRRVLMVLGVLVMLLCTAFLAESLLLRVTTVRVTGDMIYPEEEIINTCGYNEGDNLLFLPDREAQLKARMPYISQVKLVKKIPGTVEINITAAQPVCCLQAGGTWLTLDREVRVLEAGGEAKAGIPQVYGLSPTGYNLGAVLDLGQDEAAKAFWEIVETIADLEAAGNFTRLNLTNVQDIRLWYQDRVELRLGTTVELEHKLRYGYGLFDSNNPNCIPEGASGVLDLNYLPDRKRAFFEEGEVDPNSTPQANPTIQPTAVPSSGDDSQPEGQEHEESGEDENSRGGDIPEDVFTG